MIDLGQWLGLALAVLLGGIVGMERELSGQPAGLRTHALVALGAALFTIVAIRYAEPPTTPAVSPGEAMRVVAALVTGVGFLGAGAIVRAGGSVQGLTTAATVWSTAAVGLAAGSGFYLLATISVALMLIILRGFSWLKDQIHIGQREDRG